MIHYYYGDGVGKTTAAAGLAVRACGVMKTVFVQFLKDGTSSETAGLKKLGIDVIACEGGVKFVSDMTDEEKSAVTVLHTRNLRSALDGGYEMIVLDEIEDAYRLGVIDRKLVEDLLASPPVGCELVMTGHSPNRPFLDAADYLTKFVNVKHPYEDGIPARPGIEF